MLRPRDAPLAIHVTSRSLTPRRLARQPTHTPMNRNAPRLLLLVASLLLAALPPAAAQSEGTGTITGRVYNSASKEYIRDAEIHVEGTNITVPSGTSGVFSLARVPAGEVTLRVTYTGLPPATTKVTVAAGQVVEREIELGG